MISHRVLIPVAYLAPLQCLVLALALRSIAPPQTLWQPLAGLLGILLGIGLAVFEVVALVQIRDPRNRSRAISRKPYPSDQTDEQQE